MRLPGAFFSLIRWPNLVFIALTQCLFYFAVAPSTIPAITSQAINLNFYLLVIASVIISAAGYIINDYFDVQIDAVNKPEKLIVGKKIKRRWAIVWHLLLSFFGLALSIYVSLAIKSPMIGVINFGCIILLWIYSISLKRSLLFGNISIAALTAWVILVMYFFVTGTYDNISPVAELRLFKFTILYASFAFIVTLIREVVKDIEDMEGDREYYSNTMPIAWGVPVAKIFTAVWIAVCTCMLLVVIIYALQLYLWYISVYSFIFLICPLCWLLAKLYKAKIPSDYHRLSTVIKFIMLAGILSMLFFFLRF